MKIFCDVVTDLLPLYYDGVCNQVTKKLVSEHLDECASCRALLDKIGNTTIDNKIKAERQEVIANQAKALEKRYSQNIVTAINLWLLISAIITCLIVDLAISGTFTWSLIPVSACVFAGFVLTPITKNGVKGIVPSIIILSILIMPFLFVLSLLINSGEMFMHISIWMSVISIVYIWSVVAVFKMLKLRKLLASAVSLILLVPLSLTVNTLLASIAGTPLFDVWNALSFVILAVIVAILFFFDFKNKKSS